MKASSSAAARAAQPRAAAARRSLFLINSAVPHLKKRSVLIRVAARSSPVLCAARRRARPRARALGARRCPSCPFHPGLVLNKLLHFLNGLVLNKLLHFLNLLSTALVSTALVPIGIPLFSSAPVDFFSTELFHSLLEIIIIMT
jgi:hypothetical protein